MSRAANISFLLSGLRSRVDGSVVNGGSVAFYEAGTTTQKYVYTEKEKTNGYYSYTLDESGSAELFGEGEYDIVVSDSSGNELYTIEGVRLEHPYYGVRSVSSSPVTMASTDDLLLVDTSSEGITVNCLAAASWNRPLKVQHIAGSNNVVINPSGSETVNGSSTLAFQNTTVELASDGSNLKSVGSGKILADADGDTKIQVEESSDEDIIRFDIAGSEVGTIDADGLTMDEVDATELKINGTAVTATATELNILSGVTSSATDLNRVDNLSSAAVGVDDAQTLTSKQLTFPGINEATAVTATSTEINASCDGIGTTIPLVKVVSFSSWDMDSDATKDVAHGVSSGATKIISVRGSLTITGAGHPIPRLYDAGGAGTPQCWVDSWGDTNVVLMRLDSGIYDNATYNSTSGYLVIEYIS